MKRTILLLLISVLCVAAIRAQNSDKAIYVIDGKQVENFDGSQLKWKTIVNYTIDTKHNTHIITTSDMADSLNMSDSAKVKTEVIMNKESQIIYVVNGKIVPYSEVKNIPTSKIASIAVVKNKQDPEFIKVSEYFKDAIKYGKLDPKCIIKITTK